MPCASPSHAVTAIDTSNGRPTEALAMALERLGHAARPSRPAPRLSASRFRPGRPHAGPAARRPRQFLSAAAPAPGSEPGGRRPRGSWPGGVARIDAQARSGNGRGRRRARGGARNSRRQPAARGGHGGLTRPGQSACAASSRAVESAPPPQATAEDPVRRRMRWQGMPGRQAGPRSGPGGIVSRGGRPSWHRPWCR